MEKKTLLERLKEEYNFNQNKMTGEYETRQE